MPSIFDKPVLQLLHDKLFDDKELKIWVLREDLVHPFMGGNKWRKLKYNLQEFVRLKKECLVTFGGAFSNHIVATAAAGKEFGFKTIGIIRGEELHEHSNDVLKFASKCGMKLVFVSREQYRLRNDPGFIQHLPQGNALMQQISSYYVVPEGGGNEWGIKGCKEIIQDIEMDFDVLCCACGTGATLAGIATSLKEHQKALGIAVLHATNSIQDKIEKQQLLSGQVTINDYFTFGGYGKSNHMLEKFCSDFEQKHNIPIEPVYTGKLFYAVYKLAESNHFKTGSRIVVLHSGGIFNFTDN